MASLKIAFLIPVFPEIHNTFILNQITGLIDLGHDVHLYPLAVGPYESAHPEVARYRLRERDMHVRVPRSKLERAMKLGSRMLRPGVLHASTFKALDPRNGKDALSLVDAYTAISFAQNRRYDVLHAQFGTLAPLAERLVSWGAVRAKLVVSFRGADTTSYLPRHPAAFARVFERGSLFLPVSADLRDRVIAAGAPPEKTQVHRSGIELRRFTFRPRSLQDGERAELLFVGRFVEKKGVLVALRALAKALPEARSGAHLKFVGSGPLEADMRSLVAELGLTEHVTFAGSLGADEVAEAMRSAHVLVAPSLTAANGDTEGVPNVVKEAMASGMPVLSTVHGGIPELVEDGVSGVLVPENDVDALARGLSVLLRSPARWPAMGTAGRQKVEAEYDSARLNELLVERYRSLL